MQIHPSCIAFGMKKSALFIEKYCRHYEESQISLYGNEYLGNSKICCINPTLHLGHLVISLPVSLSIICRIVSLTGSKKISLGLMSFRIRGMVSFLFLWDRNPKYLIFTNPEGSTCRRKRRINSYACKVIVFLWLPLFRSL